MSLETHLRAAPRAELHLHLEGAVRATTELTLAERNGVALPNATRAESRSWLRFRNVAHFIEVYGAIGRCLRTADDYELIAYDLAEELAGQNVRYAEVGFSHQLDYRSTFVGRDSELRQLLSLFNARLPHPNGRA